MSDDKRHAGVYRLTDGDLVELAKIGRLEKENAKLKEALRWALERVEDEGACKTDDKQYLAALELLDEPVSYEEHNISGVVHEFHGITPKQAAAAIGPKGKPDGNGS